MVGQISPSYWLSQAGLPIEPEKSEIPCLETAYRRSHYQTQPSTRIMLYHHISGFFYINYELEWVQRVDIMCKRARASLKSLQLLRNSVRSMRLSAVVYRPTGHQSNESKPKKSSFCCSQMFISPGPRGIDRLSVPFVVPCPMKHVRQFGQSESLGGANSPIALIHVVGMVTNMVGETVKWLAKPQPLCLVDGGDETEYDQAYELGEGVLYDADVRRGCVQHLDQRRWAWLYFRTIMQEAAGLFPQYSYILGRPSPAFLVLTLDPACSQLLSCIIVALPSFPDVHGSVECQS
ncbi:hypothetical protein EDB84DRAFT_238105 [Lactarius hengduanensis]|nr:hypothetical protein EDB84DRAFT_238105 [Lactarius hengduanensis]